MTVSRRMLCGPLSAVSPLISDSRKFVAKLATTRAPDGVLTDAERLFVKLSVLLVGRLPPWFSVLGRGQ